MAEAPAPSSLRAFSNEYLRSLDRHTRAPSEASLQQAYDLGRGALERRISILDLAAVHHQAIRLLLPDVPSQDLDDYFGRAADFLTEALSAYEVVRLGFAEVRAAERQQHEHAALVRRLSALLADTSLAVYGRDSIAEVLQLVAEHARELTHAARCVVELEPRVWAGQVKAIAGPEVPGGALAEPDVELPLTSLDGSPLGTLRLWRPPNARPLSSLDCAVGMHVAELASAALDRASMFAGR